MYQRVLRSKMREGKIELHEYISYEYVPGKIIKHVWETASYETSDGESCNTLPAEQRNKSCKRGVRSRRKMLAFILVEKYAYHSSKESKSRGSCARWEHVSQNQRL